MKYRIIYADPPWNYGSKSAVNNSNGNESVELSEHYDSMTVGELCSLPVSEVVKDEAACFMWVTDSHLKEGIEVMESWGFEYKTIGFVWLKKTKKWNNCVNVAPWTLKSTEVCLFGTRGAMTKYKKDNSVHQFIEAIREEHSKKPNEVRERIDKLFGDVNRVELFARQESENWDVWGNEVNKDLELLVDES